ncbi:MAG: nucleoside phosphorylase [Promethearchaeota archaeon]
MTFPNFPHKQREKALVTPDIFRDYRKELGRYPEYDPPQGVIFVYQSQLMNYIVNNHPVTKVEGFFGDFYLLEDMNKQIGVLGNFGIGAPIIGILVEELVVFGVKKIISIGVAGSLQKNVQLGSIILCDKAIRDEGTSHHYLPSEKYVYPSKVMKQAIENTINSIGGITYVSGTTWTTDAPYRETIAEVAQYQEEGVITVDMEAAALFAVAEYRKVEVGAIFTISDYLGELEWKPQFHLTKEHEKNLFLIAMKALST